MSLNKLFLPVESVQERDIDFLLVEEFLSSNQFIDFFVDKLDLPASNKITSVQRSINDFGLGETDVLVEYLHENSKIGLLIENKLDAFFQPKQAERYTSRAKLYQTERNFAVTYSILVAPAQYIDGQSDFSLCVSYEMLAEYFQDSDIGKRADFKIELLRIATEKLRRGYVTINSEQNQAFWLRYRQFLATEAPAIVMKPVSVVPAKSDWIDLSVGEYKLIHKLLKGQLDLIDLDQTKIELLADRFNQRSKRIQFKSGEALRIQTTKLDRMKSFDAQLSEVSKCVRDLNIVVAILS